MAKEQTPQEKAQEIFEKMPMEKQKELKEQFPKLYNALWQKDKVDLTAISEFIDKHTPENEKITSFEDLEKLSLSAQIEFKEKYPEEYQQIMNLSTDESKRRQVFKKVQSADDFEKLSDADKLVFKKEFPVHYKALFDSQWAEEYEN